jgi:arylsulfatase A-like enzyme
MFERGIKGHNAPVLYNPLVRVPLLVHQPGQTNRADVHATTSCTDLLPTLALAAGLPVPDWCEGRPLPLFPGSQPDMERTVYALDARRNAKYRPLETGTIAMVKGHRKFMAYFGYREIGGQYELYDLESDPQELTDLSKSDGRTARLLRQELDVTLKQVNLPFLG